MAALCDAKLAPEAETVDRSASVPIPALHALADAGFTAATLRREDGGLGLGNADQWRFHERIAGACGNTWFVLVQHLGSCSQVASTKNDLLRERLLRDMARGTRWVGVAFGHLRRPVPPVVAEPCAGGWRISGTAPWMTGWPLLSDCIVGARLPDGNNLFAWIPLANGPGVTVSAPLPLSAMGATGTVEVVFDHCHVPESSLLRIAAPSEMVVGDRSNLLKTTAPLLGLAQAALRTARKAWCDRPIPDSEAGLARLDSERDTLRGIILSELIRPLDETDEAFHRRLRASAIELTQRCALASVIASAGASNHIGHPAQRHLREAAFYAVFQQTSAIAMSTLELLAERTAR